MRSRKSKPASIGQATVTYGQTTNILTKATGFIDAYDYSLNPYSGCSFGCMYCYAAFFNQTTERRDGWGYWVHVKENAAKSLEKRLRKANQALDNRRIYMSSVTDPYQPIERKTRITRALLEILVHYKSKVTLVIQTRSPDVVRDLDLYRQIEAGGGHVQINMSVTTDDEAIRRMLEPFCPDNRLRLEAISKVARAGLRTCLTLTPLLWLSDAQAFAKQVRATLAQRVVTQPFHFGRGRFVAMTREQAIRLMVQKLGCDFDAFQPTYLQYYKAWRQTLEDELSDSGCELSEGKEGFAPLF